MFSFGRKSKTTDEPATPPAEAPAVELKPAPTPTAAPEKPAARATPPPSSVTAPASPPPPSVTVETPKPEPIPAIPAVPLTPATPAPVATPVEKTSIPNPVSVVKKLPTSDLSMRRRRQIQALRKSLAASRKQSQLMRRRFIQPNGRPLIVVSKESPPPPVASEPASTETPDITAELAKAPAFVEMQYEIADLRNEIDLLRTAAKADKDVPALDPEALKLAVPTAPAFVELQYEAVDLRSQVDSLQKELAKVRKIFTAFGQD